MYEYSWLYLPPDIEIGETVMRLERFTARQLRHNGVELGACLLTLDRRLTPPPPEAPPVTWENEERSGQEIPLTYLPYAPEEVTTERIVFALDLWAQWYARMRRYAALIEQQDMARRDAPPVAQEWSPVWQAQLVPGMLRERQPLDVVVTTALARHAAGTAADTRKATPPREPRRAPTGSLSLPTDTAAARPASAGEMRRWLASPVDDALLQGDVVWSDGPFSIYRIWLERVGVRRRSPQFRITLAAIPTEWHGLVYADDRRGRQRLHEWQAQPGSVYSLADAFTIARTYWLRSERWDIARMALTIRKWPADGDQATLARLKRARGVRKERLHAVWSAMRALEWQAQ